MAFIFFATALMPTSVTSGASLSFLAAKPSRTVASSFGSVADTGDESALRMAMPQYFEIVLTAPSSITGVNFLMSAE
ncbi:MAG: hypothetical protein MUC86_12830 [Burkholderiaceae bacterium]|nr:hypothetical protein [Burkholderiaceae bacterium]